MYIISGYNNRQYHFINHLHLYDKCVTAIIVPVSRVVTYFDEIFRVKVM